MEGSNQVALEPPIFGRVTVDLSEFFKDFRKFCMVYLDYNQMKTVQDLKDYLIRTFEIRGNFVLMTEDFLLLEKDNLRVLRQGDHVWLISPGKYSSHIEGIAEKRAKHFLQQTAAAGSDQNKQDQVQSKTNSKSSLNGLPNANSRKRTNESEVNLGVEEAEYKLASNSIVFEEEKQQSKCYEPEEQESGSEVRIPRERHKKLSNAVCENGVLLTADISKNGRKKGINPTEDKNFRSPSNSLIPLKTAVVEEAAADEVLQKDIQSEEEEVSDWSSAPLPKRKRIRKRRSKKTHEAVEPSALEAPTLVQSAPPSVPIRHHPGRTHIRFDGETEKGSVKGSNEATDDEESTALRNYPPTSSSRRAPNSQHYAKYNTGTSNDLSQLLSQTKPIVFERNLSHNPKQLAPSEEQQRNSQQLASNLPLQSNYWSSLSDEQLWNNPTLKEAPALNEIIAFKVLCLGPDYTPQLSPWLIAAVATEQLTQTDKLRLSILRGSNPLYRKDGKFEMKDMSEEQEEEFITIAWQDMVTPRIIPPVSSNVE